MNASRLVQPAAALALLLVVAGLVVEVAVAPAWTAFARLEEDRAAAEAAIARLLARVQGRGAFADQIDALERDIAQSDLRVSAATPAIAAAALQRRLTDAAQNAGAEIVSAQTLESDVEEAGLTRIAVRADLRASTGALATLLYELETGRPFLFVDRLRLRSAPGAIGAGPGSDEAPLTVQIDVSAYMAPGAGE